jgi:hypothetical protein
MVRVSVLHRTALALKLTPGRDPHVPARTRLVLERPTRVPVGLREVNDLLAGVDTVERLRMTVCQICIEGEIHVETIHLRRGSHRAGSSE